MRPLALVLALCVGPLVASAEAPAKASAREKKPKVKAPSFSLPSFGELPKAEGLTEKKSEVQPSQTKSAAKDPTYAVLEVRHAAGFSGGPTGPQPLGNYLEALDVRGKPLSTERFSTVVTIQSAAKLGAPIDVAVLDTRGDTVLSATGEISFVDQKSDTTRYQIDWDPSPVRGPGAYQVLVRIAGRPMGTWPLKVRADPSR